MSSNDAEEKPERPDQTTRQFDGFQPTEAFDDLPNAPTLAELEDDDFELDIKNAVSISLDELPVKMHRYVLSEKIGEGGTGVVYRADYSDEIPPEKRADTPAGIAIKLIKPEIVSSPMAVKRFLKESRLLAEISSPFVTRHVEFGQWQGRYFIASEFVVGVGLDRICQTYGALSIPLSLLVARDLLRALDAMHQRAVIHRDVKPGNIIIGMRSGQDLPETMDASHFQIAKLTDFGLARHVDQSASLAMTRQQAILGTPQFMAPEQHRESRNVDARADVYSVGISMYLMLAGRLPFEANDPITMAEMHRHERPRALHMIRPEVGEALSNVVAKAIEKEPELRYQSASEMLDDVEPY